MSNEDKMREEAREWAERDEFSRWVFDPKSDGYPIRNPHDAQLGWKACAAIKDAEIAEARKTAEYWKAEHLAGNKEIAARDLMIKDLRESLLYLVEVFQIELSEVEHAFIKEAIAQSEHHNSRALEKMLLEARIDELKQLHSFTAATNGTTSNDLLRYIKNAKAKLAELSRIKNENNRNTRRDEGFLRQKQHTSFLFRNHGYNRNKV